jgi:hypothetical protein
MHRGFWKENLKGNDYLEEMSEDGGLIMNFILNK